MPESEVEVDQMDEPKSSERKHLQLKELVQLTAPDQSEPLLSIQWEDQDAQLGKQATELAAISSKAVYLWDLESASIKNTVNIQNGKSTKRDPHNSNLLAYSCGKRFEILDLRTKVDSIIKDKDSLHSMQLILDLDYNPIKVNTLATVGQDSCIRFWDLRKIDQGVCIHSFNPTSMSTSS